MKWLISRTIVRKPSEGNRKYGEAGVRVHFYINSSLLSKICPDGRECRISILAVPESVEQKIGELSRYVKQLDVKLRDLFLLLVALVNERHALTKDEFLRIMDFVELCKKIRDILTEILD